MKRWVVAFCVVVLFIFGGTFVVAHVDDSGPVVLSEEVSAHYTGEQAEIFMESWGTRHPGWVSDQEISASIWRQRLGFNAKVVRREVVQIRRKALHRPTRKVQALLFAISPTAFAQSYSDSIGTSVFTYWSSQDGHWGGNVYAYYNPDGFDLSFDTDLLSDDSSTIIWSTSDRYPSGRDPCEIRVCRDDNNDHAENRGAAFTLVQRLSNAIWGTAHAQAHGCACASILYGFLGQCSLKASLIDSIDACTVAGVACAVAGPASGYLPCLACPVKIFATYLHYTWDVFDSCRAR
jgi:hypothetical protein